MNMRATILAIFAGLLVELFFRLVKYRDSLTRNYPRPKYTSYDNYATVSEYVSGGSRRWVHYSLFRILPPIVVLLLLASILKKYYLGSNHDLQIVLAGAISILFRDGYNLFQRKSPREKLMHAYNIVLVLAATTFVLSLNHITDLGVIAPSISGIIDNLWSALFVAILVVLYLDATNIADNRSDDVGIENAKRNYVVSSFEKIHALYSGAIDEDCKKYKCSKPLLYSVLVYENMNRPRVFRMAENLIVQITKRELTLGIAQVRSRERLSDRQSIQKAAKILEQSFGIGVENVQQVLKPYNSDFRYYESIKEIMELLKVYESIVFSE